MPPGYGNVLSVFDAQDRVLGRWRPNSRGQRKLTSPRRCSRETGEVVSPRADAPQPGLANERARSAQPEAPAIAPGAGAMRRGSRSGGAILLLVILFARRSAAARRVAVALLALGLVAATAHAQRQMEKLGRGVIAVRSSSTQVYVGWRLLGNDPDDIAFNLYRSANGGAPVKINALAARRDDRLLDTPANLSTTSYAYSVRPGDRRRRGRGRVGASAQRAVHAAGECRRCGSISRCRCKPRRMAALTR